MAIPAYRRLLRSRLVNLLLLPLFSSQFQLTEKTQGNPRRHSNHLHLGWPRDFPPPRVAPQLCGEICAEAASEGHMEHREPHLIPRYVTGPDSGTRRRYRSAAKLYRHHRVRAAQTLNGE